MTTRSAAPLGVMMALGSYRFSLSTAAYDRLVRTAAWRWPSQEVIGGAPVRQSLGPAETTLELTGISTRITRACSACRICSPGCRG